jgi:methylenetetrahydrofolate reductase (NADPH)
MIRAGVLGGGLAKAAPLLADPRFEVFPAAGAEDAVAGWLPAGATVTVTASPGKGLDATVSLAERLAGRGYRVVPHLSARLVSDDAHLAAIVARLTACGIDDVFVPAGDADPPAGPYDSALPLLMRLAEMGSPFARTGITGYPESHPRIGDDVTIQAMWDKRRYASYIVSNLCFDPAVLRRWITRIRDRGVTLPLYLGLAGPLERTRLLRRVRPVPGRAHRVVPANGHPRRLPARAVAGPAGTGADHPRRRGRGPASVHLQPGGADRAVAPGTAGQAELTGSWHDRGWPGRPRRRLTG